MGVILFAIMTVIRSVIRVIWIYRIEEVVQNVWKGDAGLIAFWSA